MSKLSLSWLGSHMIDMKKIFGGEAKQNRRVSTMTNVN
jgi:hypothetical protein